MKRSYIFPILATITLSSWASGGNIKTDKLPSQEKIVAKTDTAKWIDEFRAFRDAVYQNDRKKVKTFVDFPITEQTDNIWGGIVGVEYKTDDNVPFTEKDFDKYYDKLFTKTFIKCLLKIKSEELYKKGQVSSPEFKVGETTYSLGAYVKESNKVYLNFFSKAAYKVAEGEYDVSEFSVIYCFSILKNGKIKMRHVLTAG